MEPIKVSVEVKVDFSENTKEFINELVKTIANVTSASTNSAAPKAAPAVSSARAAVPAAKPAAPTTPAATSTGTPEPVAPVANDVTIEQVRQALAAKVNSHREEIKAKLSEFGAPSVTRLDPSYYTDMLIFLNSLS